MLSSRGSMKNVRASECSFQIPMYMGCHNHINMMFLYQIFKGFYLIFILQTVEFLVWP